MEQTQRRADFSPESTVLGSGRLDFAQVARAVLADGLVAEADRGRIQMSAAGARSASEVHPLVLLANLKLAAAAGGELSLERLTEWLARRVEVRYLRIDPTRVDVASVTAVVSQAYARRHRILPLAVEHDRVLMATSEPLDLSWKPDLTHLTRRHIELALVNPLDLHRYTMEFFGVTRSVRGAKDQRDREQNASMPSFEQLVDLGQSGEVGADDHHVVQIVDWMLQYAYEQRASDIHLEPRRELGRIRFRIDGVLHKVFELPPPVMTAVVSRIKVLGRMDLAERRRPQDGRIKTRSPGGREVEMRLSTMPTAFGEKCVMRIFDPDTAFKPIAELGFSPTEAAGWNALVEAPHGIVLVTGPTGSGKTTTLYSTLRKLATADVNVCTVEDPIEMISPEFNQMQVQNNIDLDFASGVRTLLRQDPDIIMIGEIRDLETAQMAVQASLTGHLVLSTLHTNDAPSAITRLLDLGVAHYLVASTLSGVLAQRLVRTLCPHCRQPTTLPAHAWDALLETGRQVPEDAAPNAPVGCLECRRTGYMGRVGLYELMPLTPQLRAMIRADMDLAAFTRAARIQGMRTLRDAGLDMVARGLTTIEEVVSVLPPRE
ncbi:MULTISPECIES: GspE/PulE family protein [Pseudoxanthomonas]|uniref:Type II/IV secretion system protein n=1 Tax=Pseudoxanthomonas winnipegensis TaxID=2480810 RepID=A0A4Q8LQF7_9GAMM|nr:GspE/PulE family protein [Pseudoxanthomonas winnipegensis]RZZ89699.1 type II/IV secretion system protein [Pseudoxanthomonas winnipegensis]TAA32875.1 type II/IV secretion system protein [Pseudoxanthomonas winnipegensis]TAA40866.1 type II/IV secretion system protein [Pseudoxanthomonas winnipegensis]TAA43119.1 type II/IV secretion system protein [Pseudoxanthomonas winnipegensis]TBV78642.1 type II/IV secretion system protein [Pseudoxanthomonas winnipegensis]